MWDQKSVEYNAGGRCTWVLLKSVAVTQEITILPLELYKTKIVLYQSACITLAVLIDFLSLI